ncbi:type IV pilus modification PilV family protein [Aliamphritea spongicola]|uniref:type IV pilus modification PilV family protein n=1 Tax=Aliamphritea spongicola TaxID=707589 RepID=UPI00196A60DD|nr:prepilin-type N-terminal cleavage/methylation domain-containing protein [Aliamphritea spongicola]MBN3561217.1 prepilin-type N-terminal cleavage/methylation domain-containing protein [Aliamphritea spongicola]
MLPCNARGFTLLEVLVALSIASVSVAVVLMSLADSAKNVQLNRHYQYGLSLAQSQLEEVVSRQPLMPGNQSGVSGSYRWKSQVSVLSEDDITTRFRLYRIRVEVSWNNRADYPVSLQTMRLGAVYVE